MKAALRLPQVPTPATPFLGRDVELTTVRRHLTDPACRLLTLSGWGGVGKTRLALQVVAENRAAFRDGIFLVPLAEVGSSETLVTAIADAVQFVFYSPDDPVLQLQNFLRDKKMLVVLDHFDRLLGSTSVIRALLGSAQDLKFLITSRQRLGAPEEWELGVDGLEFPKDGTSRPAESFGSVRLFMECARRVRPDFQLNELDRPAVMSICRRLEGMPLGIELAASWAATLTCAEIDDNLRANHAFLDSGGSPASVGQRTLEGVIRSMWEKLSEPEKAIFRRFSIFSGGFSAEAARRVAKADSKTLDAFAAKALLRRAAGGRFEMHELLRQFARQRLNQTAEEEETAIAHCEYFAEFVRKRDAHFKIKGQDATLRRVGLDIQNIRQGWHYAVDRQNEELLRKYLLALSHYYELQSLFQEGEELFAEAIQKLQRLKGQSDDPPAGDFVWWLISRRAMLLNRHGYHVQAAEILQKCLPIFLQAGDEREIADCFNNLGICSAVQGKWDEAKLLYHQAMEIFQRIGDPRGVAWSLNLQGNAEEALGRFQVAGELYQKALSLYTKTETHEGVGWSYTNLGNIATSMGQFNDARRLYRKGLAGYARIRDQGGVAWSLMCLGKVEVIRGNYVHAKKLYQKSMLLYRQIGDMRSLARALNHLGQLAESLGQFEEAEGLYDRALKVSKSLLDRREIARALTNLATAKGILGKTPDSKALHSQSLAIYRQVGDQEGMAWAYGNLGAVSLVLADFSESRKFFGEALNIYKTLGARSGIAWTISNLGHLDYLAGKPRDACKLLNLALELYREMEERRGAAWCLMNLGNVAHSTGDYDSARTQFAEALKIYEQTDDRRGVAWGLTNLGNLECHLGRYDKAEKLLWRSLATYKQNGERRGIAWANMGLGGLAGASQDWHGARKHYQEALELYRETGDQKGHAWALTSLGGVALQLGGYAEARQLLSEALGLQERLGDPQILALTCLGLGNLENVLGNSSLAREHLGRALKIGQECQAMPLVLDVLVALGLFYLKQGSAGLAAEVLQFVRGDPAAKKETDGQARLLLKRCASSGASVGRSRGRIEDVLQNIYSH